MFVSKTNTGGDIWTWRVCFLMHYFNQTRILYMFCEIAFLFFSEKIKKDHYKWIFFSPCNSQWAHVFVISCKGHSFFVFSSKQHSFVCWQKNWNRMRSLNFIFHPQSVKKAFKLVFISATVMMPIFNVFHDVFKWSLIADAFIAEN